MICLYPDTTKSYYEVLKETVDFITLYGMKDFLQELKTTYPEKYKELQLAILETLPK